MVIVTPLRGDVGTIAMRLPLLRDRQRAHRHGHRCAQEGDAAHIVLDNGVEVGLEAAHGHPECCFGSGCRQADGAAIRV